MNIPHEEIRERRDRSWSMRLLERLQTTRNEEEVEKICETLEELEDYRLEEPLLVILHDLSKGEFARRAASQALRSSPTTDTETQRRAWWHSGDEVFRQHAVHMFEREDDDLLWEVLSDSAHLLYPDAIVKISGGYEDTIFQKTMVDALFHGSFKARRAAAHGLIWMEPVVAEDSLLIVLRDADDELFDAALTTVSFYSSQKILTGLHELSKNCPEPRYEEIDCVFGGVSHNCFNALDWARKHSPSAEHRFLEWLKPVANILDPEFAGKDNEPSDTDGESTKPKHRGLPKLKLMHPPLKILLSEFDDANGCWEKIRYPAIDWSSYKSERQVLTDFFAKHLDPCVREIGCAALAEWNETELLLGKLDDPSFAVRRSAAYNLKKVRKSRAVAEKLWQRLLEPGVQSCYGGETLKSFVKHAPKMVLADKLLEYIQLDHGESTRYNAVRELGLLNARNHLELLVPLLKEGPNPSWDFHTALIQICTEFKFEAPNLPFLMEIDDFDFQSQLAIYLAERS